MDIDMDDLKKKIQSFFDQGTVTIVGSGLSCAEGISGMKALSEKLMEDVPNKLINEDMECWRNIEETLNNGIDLESTLQQNKATNNIEKAIIESAYELISCEDMSIFTDIIEKGKSLKFSEYLSCFNIDLFNLVVITTNYDLLIEYACEIKGFDYSDSYYGKIISNYSPEYAAKEMIKGIQRGKIPRNIYKPHIKIYKPHGSINWKLVNGNLKKINHVNFGIPCIITPGSNKYEKGYEEPFDYHIGKMGQEIDNAKRLVFIGYGFNDNHLETHLNKTENISKPKLIVTRTLYDNAKRIIDNSPNTIAIEEMKINDRSYGTRVYFEKQIYEIRDKKIWDIGELIKEVF